MPRHIVVVGGGYSGVLASKLAARWTDAAVTLVNERDRFVERVRLHQLAAGQRLRDLPIKDSLEGTGVKLVVDRVMGIDAATRTVQLAEAPQPMRYDLLVYALGSQAEPDAVPGVGAHAYTVATVEGARRLRARLAGSGTVAVVGGGLTGIETAAELAESRPDLKVRLVTKGVLGSGLSGRGREYLRRAFTRLGVEVTENATVTEVDAHGLLVADGGHLGADTVVWATGFRVPPLAREAGFAVDDRGRMIVDETMRSVSHPEVHAVGDAAAPRTTSGQELRMACATGLPSAQAAVRAMSDRLTGKAPRGLRFRYYFQCISLGRRDGLIQFVHADDSPREAVISGRAAAWYKEAIVRSTILMERHPTLPAS